MRGQFRTWCVIAALVSMGRAAGAADIEAASRIDSVTVYPDGATVTRLLRLDAPAGETTLVARDFPLSLDRSSLRVEGEGADSVAIGAVDVREPRPNPPADRPEIDRRIEALRDRRAALDGVIAAATARRKFAERFAESVPAGLGEKGEARPIAEWRLAFAAVGDEIATADTMVREARVQQREIDRELSRLEAERGANPPRRLEVRIGLSAAAAGPVQLRVSYSVRNARWTPQYDARLVTGGKDRKPSLELVRRAEVVQSTGEDWADVALAVSTVRTARGGSAPELTPLIVRYPAPPPPPVARSEPRAAAAPADGALLRGEAPKMRAAVEQQATIETGGFQVLFRVPGRVSLAASEGSKNVRIGSASVAPELMVHAVPALDLTAFLLATFTQTEEAPLLPGRVAIYRDGMFVGHSAMPLTPKDETVRLGFGADEQVKVARAVVRRSEGTAGLIGSSRTDEREFKITVRNGHDIPIRVAIEDQMPVSETEDIAVEALPGMTPPTARDVRDRRGVVEWTFDAAPGETRDIKFGWRLRWPKDKSIQYTPRAP